MRRRPARSIRSAGDDLASADRRPVRPARRHRHGRVDPADRQLDHVGRRSPRAPSSLVLDVKVGTGAFMKDRPRRPALAETMVGLGRAPRCAPPALLTQMDVPLGRTCAATPSRWPRRSRRLAGRRPGRPARGDPRPWRGGCSRSPGSTTPTPAAALQDGRAMDAWRAMVAAQGGDLIGAARPALAEVEVIPAPVRRRASSTSTRWASASPPTAPRGRLGPQRGRRSSPAPGVVWHATVGDLVVEGQPLLSSTPTTPIASPGPWRRSTAPGGVARRDLRTTADPRPDRLGQPNEAAHAGAAVASHGSDRPRRRRGDITDPWAGEAISPTCR